MVKYEKLVDPYLGERKLTIGQPFSKAQPEGAVT